MNKLKYLLLNKKLENLQYEKACYDLQVQYRKMGMACRDYLVSRLEIKIAKVNKKILKLENSIERKLKGVK